MFETAVQEDSDIAIVVDRSQKNGPILGNDGSLFLATFLGKLVLRYNRLCQDSTLDPYSKLHQ